MGLDDPAIWVLADENSGNVSQCLGVAEALALPYEVKRIAYNKWARLPNIVLGSSILHMTRESAETISSPWPNLVIASGRRTVAVARYIKKRSQASVFLAQLMWPGPPVRDLDLVSAPLHDDMGSNEDIVRTLGAPHNVTVSRLATASDSWKEDLIGLSRPRIAVLIGGDTKRKSFSSAIAGDFGRRCSNMAKSLGGSLMVSTSRRTNPIAMRRFAERLEGEVKLFNWHESRNPNPYLGYLALSDAVIVTGDSMSMCTEACATGRPVFIYAPIGMTAAKHNRLHKHLFEYGAARPLPENSFPETLLNWSYPPINDANLVSNEIRKRMGLSVSESNENAEQV